MRKTAQFSAKSMFNFDLSASVQPKSMLCLVFKIGSDYIIAAHM